jgi:hypothetical protein
MDLKLVYQGPLLGATSGSPRARHKHDIRRQFHPQLKRFWELTHSLSTRTMDREDTPPECRNVGMLEYQIPLSESLAREHRVGAFRFCPLVNTSFSLHCSLGILFLRPEPPGRVIVSGDLDNRIRTLFDALRKPANESEARECAPGNGEDPFFGLLEDDALITAFNVETATLLEPVIGSHGESHAHLVISVKIWPYRLYIGNTDFLA